MKLEVKIDSTCHEPKVIVVTDRMTDEVNAVIEKLSESTSQVIAGFQNDSLHIIDQSTIYRIYAETGKVFAVTEDGEYTLRLRLYELEERLNRNGAFSVRRQHIYASSVRQHSPLRTSCGGWSIAQKGFSCMPHCS